MGNIDNKEKEFAETLKYVTRLARENKNVISKEQVDDAFSELDLDEKQLQMVYEYLNQHNIGIDEAIDTSDNLTTEENNYLQDYLESLEGLEKLSDGEKEAVSMAAIAGDKNAQDKLIENYLPLVVDVARMYAEQGVFLEELGRKTRPCRIHQTGLNRFTIVLTEGMNRQIRRMCAAMGYRVTSLRRIRVMNILLGDLPSGAYRPLSQEEIRVLKSLLAHSSGSAAHTSSGGG